MIMTVEELKMHIETNLADHILEEKLKAIELLIRKHTNNNFQNRGIRFKCSVMHTKLFLESEMLQVGDTIQISDSEYSNGVYVIEEIKDGYIKLDKHLLDEAEVMVTKVEYPVDIKMGVVGMMNWELNNRAKAGVASETISRHSVTYFDMTGDNSIAGYPNAVVGFLKPYMKARF